jgi:CBS domain-containing protein
VILASDVMTTDVTTVPDSMAIEELISLFRISRFTGVPVTDDQGRAVGVISESDILRALAYTIAPQGSGEFSVGFQEGKQGASARLLDLNEDWSQVASTLHNLLERPVRDLMTPVVHSCKPTDRLAAVCETMVWKEVHRLVVVDDDGKVVGLISSLDAMHHSSQALRKLHPEA